MLERDKEIFPGEAGPAMSDRFRSKLARDESIEEMVLTTLITFCSLGLAVGWSWLFIANANAPSWTHDPAQARTLLPPVVMLTACVVPLLAQKLPLSWRSLLFLLGMAGTLLLSYHWLSSPMWLYYLSLVVLVAGLLVGPWASFGAALILTLVLLGCSRVNPVAYAIPQALPALGLLWGAALASWLSSRSLYTALQWALLSQQRATALLRELRQRQGELNQTLEALTEATRRLERTNRELAVARERAEEARAIKEHFVATVSHELRTPLNLIVGFSEMLYLEPESYEGVGWTPELQSDIGELYRASRHLQSLVNDILDLSRINAARLPMFRELADVREIVASTLETIAPLLRQKGLSYRTVWPDTVSPVFVDQTRIRQVMINLLNNAVRFTDEGGITVRVEQRSDAVVVSVQDTGVGIPKDKLEVIFEEFQQADGGLSRRGGAGLGLALSRQFVELHGGRMWAESEEGIGSIFYFSLPLPGAPRQTVPLIQTRGRAPADLSQAPVVVVDPDPTIATMLSRYLGDRRLLTAKDMAEAESLVESEHPLAVIVNQPADAPAEAWVSAPGGLSQRYNVPVFRCSIPSASWLKQSTGLDDCLPKPVSRESLRAALAGFCRNPGTVVVVDDNPGFTNLMARLLRMEGLAREVLTAYTGTEGLRLIREARPSLVLLDLILPDIDGFAVLAALRQDPALAGTRVVAVTATSYAEEVLSRQGGHFVLTQSKGLSTGALTELLTAALQIVRPNYVESSTSANT